MATPRKAPPKPPAGPPPPEPPTNRAEEGVEVDRVARYLGVTRERIAQLIRAGYIPRLSRNRISFNDGVHGYIQSLKDTIKHGKKTETESRVATARATEMEMRVAERRRELVPVEDAQAAMDLLVALVRDELRGLPARCTRDITARRVIETEVTASTNRVVDGLGVSVEFVRKGGRLPFSASDDE